MSQSQAFRSRLSHGTAILNVLGEWGVNEITSQLDQPAIQMCVLGNLIRALRHCPGNKANDVIQLP